MAFCSNCGAPVEGKFCAKCGTAVSGTSAGGPPPANTPAPSPQTCADLTDNAAGALCYIPVLIPSILFLVWAPYSRNRGIRFHAWQALFLQIAWFVVHLLLELVTPVVGWGLRYELGVLLNLVVVVLALFMMWKTYQNQKISLPVIGDFAEKQA